MDDDVMEYPFETMEEVRNLFVLFMESIKNHGPSPAIAITSARLCAMETHFVSLLEEYANIIPQSELIAEAINAAKHCITCLKAAEIVEGEN